MRFKFLFALAALALAPSMAHAGPEKVTAACVWEHTPQAVRDGYVRLYNSGQLNSKEAADLAEQAKDPIFKGCGVDDTTGARAGALMTANALQRAAEASLMERRGWNHDHMLKAWSEVSADLRKRFSDDMVQSAVKGTDPNNDLIGEVARSFAARLSGVEEKDGQDLWTWMLTQALIEGVWPIETA